MRRVLKYDVQRIIGEFTINMPMGAQVLDIQLQNGAPTVWALVDPGNERVDRAFKLLDTGEEADLAGYAYVGTFQWKMGLVFHLFVEEES